MSAQILQLAARPQRSAVLDSWLHSREGAHERAGVQPQAGIVGSNGITSNMTADELARMLGAVATSASGVAVTPDTAMRVSTVYACISLLAGAISTLPVGIFERQGNERSKADHEYWWFLNEQANPGMTSSAMWEWLITSKFFYGDGFARLQRPSVRSSRVIGMEPLHPLDVQPFFDDEGVKWYRVHCNGGWETLDAADVFQLPSIGYDGLRSPSAITYAAREAIGTALAAESYSAKFFNGGATFDYALKTASKLDTSQIDVLLASFLRRSQQQGMGGSRAPLILSGGLEPAQLSVNSKDAEILASRIFGVEEICRIFGVPPHMVGHTAKSTSWGTGIAEQGMGFVRYTLQRHLTPIAQELNRKLWPTRARYFVEHITAALERGDIKSRFEAYRIALGRAGEQPWTDTDEIRRLENMAPNPGLKATGDTDASQPTPAAAG